MPKPLTAQRVFLYQLLTFGIYFFVWCHRLGSELSIALKRKATPSLWWFLLPGGGYYWIWCMAESLEAATGRKIKLYDTFLIYLVLNLGSLYIMWFPSNLVTTDELLHFVIIWIIAILLGAVALIVSHAIFCAIIQKKLNTLRQIAR